jgi:hypothetical protein
MSIASVRTQAGLKLYQLSLNLPSGFKFFLGPMILSQPGRSLKEVLNRCLPGSAAEQLSNSYSISPRRATPIYSVAFSRLRGCPTTITVKGPDSMCRPY